MSVSDAVQGHHAVILQMLLSSGTMTGVCASLSSLASMISLIIRLVILGGMLKVDVKEREREKKEVIEKKKEKPVSFSIFLFLLVIYKK